MIFFLIISSIFLPGITSLVGYDCEGTIFSVASISLLDVGECNQPFDGQLTSTATYIKLLQVTEYSQIQVFSCRIEIDRQIFHCGMQGSRGTLIHDGRRKYIIDVNQSTCARLHNTRTFVYGQDIVTELLPNITNHREFTLAGSITADHTCYGGQFSDAYGTWNDVIVKASIYINFKDYYASVKTKQDLVLLRSGVHCRTSELACVDDDGSNVYWSPLPHDKCQFHSYNILYQGFANKIVDTTSRYPVIYSLISDKTTLTLLKKSEQVLCGYRLIQTEYPELLIVEVPRNNTFAKQTYILLENLDFLNYFKFKLVYVEKHIQTQIEILYRNIIDKKCELERQVLENTISLAFNQPDLFAYHLMKGLGYTAIIAGEVAHIIKCIPVDVMIRSTNTCYQELPVTFARRSMFLAPKTRILKRTGTPIDCNPLLPTMYRVNGTWIGLIPHITSEQTPQTFKSLV